MSHKYLTQLHCSRSGVFRFSLLSRVYVGLGLSLNLQRHGNHQEQKLEHYFPFFIVLCVPDNSCDELILVSKLLLCFKPPCFAGLSNCIVFFLILDVLCIRNAFRSSTY